MNKVCFVFLFMCASVCDAQYIYGVETKITGVSSYGRGAVIGDVKITVQDTVDGCEFGYYTTNDNAGKDSILSLALSAFHSGSTVKINAADTRWQGSSHNLCDIEGIHLIK